jgi:hypothetical protein
MLKQNENRIEVHVAHISAKAAADVFCKIYDLSEKYEYDIDINLVNRTFDSFHICTKQLSYSKKIALFNELKTPILKIALFDELKTTTNAIEKITKQRVVML